MYRINPSVHRTLDFATLAVFAVAPLVLSLRGTPALLSYGLAAVHLVMTLLTKFHSHQSGVVPLALHGSVEILVGVVLIMLPIVLKWPEPAFTFFWAAGAVILLVRLLSAQAPDNAKGHP